MFHAKETPSGSGQAGSIGAAVVALLVVTVLLMLLFAMKGESVNLPAEFINGPPSARLGSGH